VDAQNAADDEGRPAGFRVADLNELFHSAFYVDGGFRDPRRTNPGRRERIQSDFLDFAHSVGVRGGRGVHLNGGIFFRRVYDKLPDFFEINERVFLRAVRVSRDRKNEARRSRTDSVEKTEWRQVGDTVFADRRNKGDRPRNDRGDEQAVDLPNVEFSEIMAMKKTLV